MLQVSHGSHISVFKHHLLVFAYSVVLRSYLSLGHTADKLKYIFQAPGRRSTSRVASHRLESPLANRHTVKRFQPVTPASCQIV